MKPIPGQPYTTKQGDTFQSISTSAYGIDSGSTRIQQQNPTQITLTATDEIPAGTELLIPPETENDQIRQQQLARGRN
jgi:hypothetical protein